MRLLVAGCALSFAALSLAFPVNAADIMITGNEARAPKVFKSQTGVAQGILVDVMSFVQNETGLSFKYALYPWARAYNTAVNGDAGIIGLSRTTERQAVFDYGEEPLFYDDLILVVKAGREFSYNAIEDLRGKRIGVCRGCSYGESFEQAIKKNLFNPIPGSNVASQLAMLLNDRLDVVLVQVGLAGFETALNDKSVNLDLLKERDRFVVLPKPFARDANYLAFAKSMNKRDVLRKIDQALKKGNATGAIGLIVSRHTSRNR